MFGHGENQGGQETIIAQGVRVEGDFVSQGSISIQGEVIGNVKTDADLEVGQTARIEANISAKNARIAGEIKGNADIHERLDLSASARIIGDITTQTLSVEPGASINGRITVGDFGHSAPRAGKRAPETTSEEEG